MTEFILLMISLVRYQIKLVIIGHLNQNEFYLFRHIMLLLMLSSFSQVRIGPQKN